MLVDPSVTLVLTASALLLGAYWLAGENVRRDLREGILRNRRDARSAFAQLQRRPGLRRRPARSWRASTGSGGTCGLNLGLLMRHLTGVGTPRSLQGRARALFHALKPDAGPPSDRRNRPLGLGRRREPAHDPYATIKHPARSRYLVGWRGYFGLCRRLNALEAWAQSLRGADAASASCWRPKPPAAAHGSWRISPQPGTHYRAAQRLLRPDRPRIRGRRPCRLTSSNRRVRTRTYGGVGGTRPRGSPLSRLRCGPFG